MVNKSWCTSNLFILSPKSMENNKTLHEISKTKSTMNIQNTAESAMSDLGFGAGFPQDWGMGVAGTEALRQLCLLRFLPPHVTRAL